MEICRGYENVGLFRRQSTRQLPRLLGDCLRVIPPASERTHQTLGVILGPGAAIHVFTVRQLAPKREFGCENFLYRIK